MPWVSRYRQSPWHVPHPTAGVASRPHTNEARTQDRYTVAAVRPGMSADRPAPITARTFLSRRRPRSDMTNPPNEPSEPSSTDGAPASIEIAVAPGECLARLRTLSQRGKLPGFESRSPDEFSVRAFGDPFDHSLVGMFSTSGSSGATAVTRISWRLRVLPRLPLIFLATTIFTIQPGMWLTDSMLGTYWRWYFDHVTTAYWYIPLVVLPMPWFLWRMWKKSKASAREHAADLSAAVAQACATPPLNAATTRTAGAAQTAETSG
jgi:hypothetical protein